MVDTVLSGGWIIDGTRTPPYQADLCIQDGKIVAISPQWEGNCRTRVDVTGKIVSPGFIDIHTHSDTCPFSAVFPESKVAQGITLEIVGKLRRFCRSHSPILSGGTDGLSSKDQRDPGAGGGCP